MNNFELIDDYLTNRLSDAERAAFEGELQTNAALKKEVAIQKIAIEGVKDARAAELKTMLNNVPIGATVSMQWTSALKIAAGIVGVGLLITGLSVYFNGKQPSDPASVSTSITDSVKQLDKPAVDEQKPEPTTEEPTESKETQKSKKAEQKPIGNVEEKATEPVKPKIELLDPSNELAENSTTEKSVVTNNNKTQVSVSHMTVETDASNTKYSFHYQFAQGKLHLYGDFDKGLYEILEVTGDSHAMFMYYKDLYYLLDEKQSAITKLEPIKDKALISKLKEYRGR